MYSSEIQDISVVYSLGLRCYTDMIIKSLKLKKFSSIFGSMNIKSYDNIIKCFDTNFDNVKRIAWKTGIIF
jgi:hypothetical protein